MFANISKFLADFITKDLDYDEEKNEVVAYAIEMFLLGLVGFLAILLFGFIFNALLPAALAAISGGILRRVSGGAHFDTPLKCLGFGAIIYGFIGVIAKTLCEMGFINELNIILILVCLVINYLRAPVDSESKPIFSDSLRKKLKFFSLAIVSLIFLLVIINKNLLINTSTTLGAFYQSITLLQIFNERR